MTTILTTGGRFFKNQALVDEVMDTVTSQHPGPVRVVNGKCHLGGADALVEDYCLRKGIRFTGYPVDKALDGPWPAAGPKRNRRMFQDSAPHLVVAFPGGSGTDGMMKIAAKAGTPLFDARDWLRE